MTQVKRLNPDNVPYASFRFGGEVVEMNRRQFEQALADSRLCRCNACLCCRASLYQREAIEAAQQERIVR